MVKIFWEGHAPRMSHQPPPERIEAKATNLYISTSVMCKSNKIVNNATSIGGMFKLENKNSEIVPVLTQQMAMVVIVKISLVFNTLFSNTLYIIFNTLYQRATR